MNNPKKGQLLVAKSRDGYGYGILQIDCLDTDKREGIVKIIGDPPLLQAPPFYSTRYSLRFKYSFKVDGMPNFYLLSQPTLPLDATMDHFEIGLLTLDFANE